VSQSDGIPEALKSTAGVIWRILVILAGLAVIGLIFNQIFAVVFALFFAMLVTAWTQPVMNLFHKVLPKVISMILALIVIISAILVILYVVVSSSISEGPKLVSSITSGFDEIKKWLQTGPLQLSDSALGNLLEAAPKALQVGLSGVRLLLLMHFHIRGVMRGRLCRKLSYTVS
jgi:predicted PurR-regulated permease PerM